MKTQQQLPTGDSRNQINNFSKIIFGIWSVTHYQNNCQNRLCRSVFCVGAVTIRIIILIVKMVVRLPPFPPPPKPFNPSLETPKIGIFGNLDKKAREGRRKNVCRP